jgi:hypoxanthine phosphoribosyltransferase
MGALLDQGELLSSLVTQMAKEIKKELTNFVPNNAVVIGLDSWGAILASQVSVMTGVKNYCIAGRAKGLTHTASERISETVRNGVVECDLIILISDVIGTGMSLKGVYDDLSEKMTPEQKEQVKWTLLSVICDDRYDRQSNLCFAHTNMTACKDLRMPILKNDDLPSESVLPADITFIRH